jgi:hypothetical protein
VLCRVVDELQYGERHRDGQCIAWLGLTMNMHAWTHDGRFGLRRGAFILRLGSTLLRLVTLPLLLLLLLLPSFVNTMR